MWRRGESVIQDMTTAVLVRQIILISLAMACLAIVSSILQLVSGAWFSVGIIAAVILPCCGWFGALYKKRLLLRLFAATSFVLAALFLASFITVLSVYRGDYVGCLCDPACRSEKGLPASQAQAVCPRERTYRALWWVSMAFGFMMAALQCSGAVLASRLANQRWYFLTAVPAAAAAPVQFSQPPPPAPPDYVFATQPPRPSAPPAGTQRYTYAAGPTGTRG